MPTTTTSADLEAVLGRYRELFDQAVEGWDAFIDTLLQPLPTWVWANPARLDGAQLNAVLADAGIVAEPVPWLAPWWAEVTRHQRSARPASEPSPTAREAGPTAVGAAGPSALRLPPGFKAGQHWWYCAGLAHAQEAVSQLPVMLLDVVPGQRVLDLCAAPGGKSAQLALALGNRGTLVANDFAAERIAALQGNLDRLGVVNTSTTRCDGGNYPAAAGAFDRVLVDAPCSSEGTLRRNPSLALRDEHGLGPERARRMAGRQRALLRKAVQLCRPGGRILYSTCTFAPEENELIVAEVLDEQGGDLDLAEVGVPGLITGPGVTRWQGRTLDPRLARCLRIWPQHNDTGGFFIAVLVKSARARGLDRPAGPALGIDADDETWLHQLATHYGLTDTALAGYRAHRQTRRGLHLVAADHAPPARPATEGSGLFSYRTNIRPPKLTTGAALLLGSLAQRQRLELDAAQRDRYLRREPIAPSAAQAADCRPGQVLVTHRGFSLGVAVLHRSGELESLFPRRWSGCTAGHD